MNGAQALLQTPVDADVEVCFTNSRGSAMPFVAALDTHNTYNTHNTHNTHNTYKGIRGLPGLFRGWLTGAADSHARMGGRS